MQRPARRHGLFPILLDSTLPTRLFGHASATCRSLLDKTAAVLITIFDSLFPISASSAPDRLLKDIAPQAEIQHLDPLPDPSFIPPLLDVANVRAPRFVGSPSPRRLFSLLVLLERNDSPSIHVLRVILSHHPLQLVLFHRRQLRNLVSRQRSRRNHPSQVLLSRSRRGRIR